MLGAVALEGEHLAFARDGAVQLKRAGGGVIRVQAGRRARRRGRRAPRRQAARVSAVMVASF
jgi:hypothetical protein